VSLVATALADDLVLGAMVVPGALEPAQLALKATGGSQAVAAQFLWLPDDLVVFTAQVPESQGQLWLRTAGGFDELGELSDALTTSDVLARERLAALDPVLRAGVCEFAARSQVAHSDACKGIGVNRRLAELNELLRERLPFCEIGRQSAHGLAVEVLLAVDPRTFYARGWFASRDAPAVRLTAVSPEGSRVELLPRVYRHARPDVGDLYGDAPHEELVKQSGFAVCFELDTPSLLDSGWVFELEDAAADGVETVGPPVVRERLAVRNTILGDLVLEPPYEQEFLAEHVHPAITRVQEENAAAAELAEVRAYGEPVQAPDVSIVVPLYGRADLIEHQLAQFAHDPDLRDVDLVYVLDSPELARSLDYDARQLFELYRIPFRVAVLRRNVGYSAANNLGASIARGRLLLLLNSDVLPDRPGWLDVLLRFHDATPAVGALGAKLLYEDDTIQHAGIHFVRDPSTQLWGNEHRFKGAHRSLGAANLPERVDAVTGACLLISRELYQAIGGLRAVYVQGDFEDSDLCLRLTRQGFENWYLPEAELYHLEGQSYAAPLRGLTSRYNAWLHTWLHGAQIEALGDVPIQSSPRLLQETA
jgi:GT2 family glycosyltransferase